MTILPGTANRELVALRNAVEIGRSGVVVAADLPRIGARGYLLLDGAREGIASEPADRPAPRWLA